MNVAEKYKAIPHKRLVGMNCKNYSGRLSSRPEDMRAIKVTSGKCRIAVAKSAIISIVLGESLYRGVQLMPNEIKKITTATMK
jgi:hypothetical protein